MIDETVVKLLADGLIVGIILLGGWALVYKVPKGHRYEAYTRILMAGLTAFLVAKLLGQVYQPAELRPFELLGVEAGASFLANPGFPSDHVLLASAITFAVLFETRLKIVTGILVVFTVLMALGRVMALVHTPLDVIGGAIVAAVGALWYFQALRTKKADSTSPLRFRQ